MTDSELEAPYGLYVYLVVCKAIDEYCKEHGRFPGAINLTHRDAVELWNAVNDHKVVVLSEMFVKKVPVRFNTKPVLLEDPVSLTSVWDELKSAMKNRYAGLR